MEIGAALIGLALMLVAAVFLASPFLGAGLTSPTKAQGSERKAELLRKRGALRALRDLDFDHALGKLSEQDYQAVRARILKDAAGAIEALDQHDFELDAKVEEEVRRLRSSRGRDRYCHRCGSGREPDNRFCRGCGAELPPVSKEATGD
jgi:hypothetical protein